MLRRLKGYERRLAHLAGRLREWVTAAEQARQRHKARALVAALARAGLAAAGIDPDTAASLQCLDTPAALLPTPPPRRAIRRETLFDHLRALTARFHHGPPPDPARAAPLALVGYYCFGDGAKQTP